MCRSVPQMATESTLHRTSAGPGRGVGISRISWAFGPVSTTARMRSGRSMYRRLSGTGAGTLVHHVAVDELGLAVHQLHKALVELVGLRPVRVFLRLLRRFELNDCQAMARILAILQPLAGDVARRPFCLVPLPALLHFLDSVPGVLALESSLDDLNEHSLSPSQSFRPNRANRRACGSSPADADRSSPNTPAPRHSVVSCCAMGRQASTSRASSLVFCPVAFATSQPWTSRSMNS